MLVLTSYPQQLRTNPVVISYCCWCLLSPLLTASCRSASNCFLQTSSSAHQRLGLGSSSNLYNLYTLNVTTWPSYPLVEPACAKKAVTILNFLPDGCLLYPTLVLPTMMEAEHQGSIFIILIFTIFSMYGIRYHSPLPMSEVPALLSSKQSISGAARMNRYTSALNIPLSFRPETETPSPSSMHLSQMGGAGVEGLPLLLLTHATVHP